MAFTQTDLKEELESRGYPEHKAKEFIRLIKVEYSIINRQKLFELSEGRLKIPNFNKFMTAIKAFSTVCGPYTKDDVERLNKIPGEWEV